MTDPVIERSTTSPCQLRPESHSSPPSVEPEKNGRKRIPFEDAADEFGFGEEGEEEEEEEEGGYVGLFVLVDPFGPISSFLDF